MSSDSTEVSPDETVVIGAAGHRLDLLDVSEYENIQRAIERVIRTVANELPTSEISLLTSLAEGSDRLFAWTALREGLALHLVLPAHRTVFADDFASSASREEFHKLLSLASAIDEPACDSAAANPPDYDAVSNVLIDQADIIAVVWNGQKGRGAGGTADTIEKAQSAGMPVLWINPLHPSVITVIVPRTGMPSGLKSLVQRFPPGWLATSAVCGR